MFFQIGCLEACFSDWMLGDSAKQIGHGEAVGCSERGFSDWMLRERNWMLADPSACLDTYYVSDSAPVPLGA